MIKEDFKELFETVTDGKTEKFEAYQDFLPELMLMFSSVKLHRNPDKSISSELTVKNIKDENIKYALKFVNAVKSRGVLYKGTAKENTRYCSLVPLFMSAHKQYNNVKYMEWDRNDIYLKVAMGPHLYNHICDYFNSRKIDVKRARTLALNYKDKKIAPTAWPRHTVNINSKLKWKGSDLVRHIYLQTWMANVECRNEYMILDTVNWDRIPTAFDVESKTVFNTEEELDF